MLRCFAGEFKEIEIEVGVARAEAAVLKHHGFGRDTHDDGRDLPGFRDKIRGGLGEHSRSMAHRAAGMRPAANLHDGGIAVNDFDLFIGDVEQIGDHLREAGLVALPVRLRADHSIDNAVRTHLDLRLLLRRPDG